jgi:hypothetical protein
MATIRRLVGLPSWRRALRRFDRHAELRLLLGTLENATTGSLMSRSWQSPAHRQAGPQGADDQASWETAG